MKDIILKDGVVTTGVSDELHQRDILISQMGWFKTAPNIGVGIDLFINEEDFSSLPYSVDVNFKKDNMQVNKIYFNESKLVVNAKYRDYII